MTISTPTILNIFLSPIATKTPVPTFLRLSETDRKILDLSRFFYIPEENEETEIYCVPLSLLPPQISASYLENALTAEDMVLSKLAPNKRKERLTKLFNCTIHEVQSIKPLTTLSGKKSKNLEAYFYKNYRKTFEDFLAESIREFCHVCGLNAPRYIQSGMKTPVRYEFDMHVMKTAALEILSSGAQEETVSLVEVTERLQCQTSYQEFKSLLVKTDSLKLASTSEPLEILFETLSLALVNHSKMPKEQQMAFLKLINEKWNRANWFIYRAYMEYEASDSIQKAIKEIESVTKEFHTISEDLPKELDKLYQPLLNFLKIEQKLKTSSGKKEFLSILYEFSKSTLSNFFICTINPILYRKSLFVRLQQRAAYLKIILEADILKESKGNIPLAKSYCDKMLEAVQEQVWPLALHFFNEIDELIGQEIDMDRIKNDLNKQESLDCLLLRLQILLLTFEKEIEELTETPELHHRATKASLGKLQKNFQLITEHKLTAKMPETEVLLDWASKFKESCPALQMNLEGLTSNAWNLHSSLLKMNSSEALKNDLGALIACIENKRSISFGLFSSLAKELSALQIEFETALRNISANIRQIQDLSFLLLLDPLITEIPLETLQQEFSNLNKTLKDLIEAPTLFFNAFQQLIRIHPPAKSPKIHDIVLQFTDKGAFGFNLFQTAKDQFEDFSQKMIASRKMALFEIESEIKEKPAEELSSALSSKTETSTVDSFENRLHSIFQETKTRKIYKNITKLLEEFKIGFSSSWGKGDHLKLYIGGVPVALPQHAEWKPGTGHSIESQIQTLTALPKAENNNNS